MTPRRLVFRNLDRRQGRGQLSAKENAFSRVASVITHANSFDYPGEHFQPCGTCGKTPLVFHFQPLCFAVVFCPGFCAKRWKTGFDVTEAIIAWNRPYWSDSHETPNT